MSGCGHGSQFVLGRGAFHKSPSNGDRRHDLLTRSGGAWAERRFQSALLLLNDATNFARDTGRDVWHYCLRLEELLSAGLTVADCRWLADKKLVDARDMARVRRRGARPRRATFTRSTRFVLTVAGVAYAAELCSRNVLQVTGYRG
ncbi:MAG TPA: hypothetical protein VND64_36420 [Pirellulales bacterium]|nr:hypothetical protein [Pirellulales bacterium]